MGEVRKPNTKELKATHVLAIPLEETSAKIRTGPPIDDQDDYPLGAWAGVIPLRTAAGAPTPDPQLARGTAPSSAVRRWSGQHP